MMTYVKSAALILGVFAVTYAIQKHVKVLPVIGPYLPGGQ